MATRKEYQRKVHNHIKDLAKRGIDPSLVTLDKSIESLSWNSKSYEAFMERKRIAIRRDKREKKQKTTIELTNNQGVDINKFDHNRLKKLNKKYNDKLKKEYKKYLAKYGKPDPITEAFLFGNPIRHKNSGENITLPENFGSIDLINRVSDNVDINEFIKLTEKKIELLRYENMIDDCSDIFESEILNPLVDSLDMHPKEKDKLMELYKGMNIVERYQFNKDMKRVMQIVESDTKNPNSMYTPYLLIREFMVKEYKREFLESY